jgi:diaminopimelate epimerase
MPPRVNRAKIPAALKFSKYHALGNDYLVLNSAEFDRELDLDEIRRLCDRHRGVGSDGILWGTARLRGEPVHLRIFNPDGSEAGMSGNGLRIFARCLWDQGYVDGGEFSILTESGPALARVHENGARVTVEIGRASFDSARIPVAGEPREVLDEEIRIDGEPLRFGAVTVGNPHCVILREEVSRAETERLGPKIERDARFPERTNVQFVKILDREHLQVEIWERGAGYTLSSGSSSAAAAALARRLGRCEPRVRVRMPGGEAEVEIAEDYAIRLTGPVVKIAEGLVSNEIFTGRR